METFQERINGLVGAFVGDLDTWQTHAVQIYERGDAWERQIYGHEPGIADDPTMLDAMGISRCGADWWTITQAEQDDAIGWYTHGFWWEWSKKRYQDSLEEIGLTVEQLKQINGRLASFFDLWAGAFPLADEGQHVVPFFHLSELIDEWKTLHCQQLLHDALWWEKACLFAMCIFRREGLPRDLWSVILNQTRAECFHPPRCGRTMYRGLHIRARSCSE